MDKKVVLITGCSSGIGFDTATTLAKRGYRVIATCRKQVDIDKIKALGIESIRLELNDIPSIAFVFETIMQLTQGRLDVLVNNAGFGQAGALEDLKPEVLLNQFNTNVFGLMELTRLAIGVMRKQGHGRIINLSSVLGVISLPFKGAYNASKYAVEGLSDTLRLELKSAGIKVITIEPGPVESDWSRHLIESYNDVEIENSFFKAQYEKIIVNAELQKSNSVFTQKTSAATKKILKAIESKNPKAKYPVTLAAYFMLFLKRLLPTKVLDRFLLMVSKEV